MKIEKLKMKETLEYLFTGNTLTKEAAYKCLFQVGTGEYTDIEFASFLTVFKMRPVTSEELAGFRQAMLELCLVTDLSDYDPIDIVGTGGDGKNTFNISTLACFVIAGSGVKVAKHGNYAVSSISGSSNLLELLGYRFSNDPGKLKSDLEKGNFCFMHAPLFHPAMKHIAPVRRALRVETFFNMLGPMINPASPKYQVLGVNNQDNFNHYRHVYEALDVNYTVINSEDGYDEVSLTAATRYARNKKEGYLSPSDFGFENIRPEAIYGGDTMEDAADIFLTILKGEGSTEQNSVVIANAAVGLNLVYPDLSLTDCVALADESLHSGRAMQKLKAVTG